MAEQTFGNRLKHLREEAGLTQQDLADRAKMNRFSVAKLEQDQYSPTWPTVQALGITCSAFEGTVEPPPPEERKKGQRGRPAKPKPQPGADDAVADAQVEPEVKPRKKRKE